MRLIHKPQGRGWEPGQLKARLQALIDKHAGVAKRPVFLYDGPPIGPVAAEVTVLLPAALAQILGGSSSKALARDSCAVACMSVQ